MIIILRLTIFNYWGFWWASGLGQVHLVEDQTWVRISTFYCKQVQGWINHSQILWWFYLNDEYCVTFSCKSLFLFFSLENVCLKFLIIDHSWITNTSNFSDNLEKSPLSHFKKFLTDIDKFLNVYILSKLLFILIIILLLFNFLVSFL